MRCEASESAAGCRGASAALDFCCPDALTLGRGVMVLSFEVCVSIIGVRVRTTVCTFGALLWTSPGPT